MPPASTFDLDIRVWMGPLSAIPLIPLGLGPFLAELCRPSRRCGARCRNFSHPDNTLRKTHPYWLPPRYYSHPPLTLESRPTTEHLLQANRRRVLLIGRGVGTPCVSSEAEIIFFIQHPIHRGLEMDTSRTHLPRARTYDIGVGWPTSAFTGAFPPPKIEPTTRNHYQGELQDSTRRCSKRSRDRHAQSRTTPKCQYTDLYWISSRRIDICLTPWAIQLPQNVGMRYPVSSTRGMCFPAHGFGYRAARRWVTPVGDPPPGTRVQTQMLQPHDQVDDILVYPLPVVGEPLPPLRLDQHLRRRKDRVGRTRPEVKNSELLHATASRPKMSNCAASG